MVFAKREKSINGIFGADRDHHDRAPGRDAHATPGSAAKIAVIDKAMNSERRDSCSMNWKDFQKTLENITYKLYNRGKKMEILKLANFDHIYEVDCFQKEFVKMTKEKMKNAPPYPRYQEWLIKKLMLLEKMGNEVLRLEGFEKLDTDNPELFSIRYPHSKLNPRVIYACIQDRDIILLTAFKEENAASDYQKGIRKARKRYKELER